MRNVVNCTCVECTLDWKRQNPDRVKGYSREWYGANREDDLAKQKAWFRTESGRAAQKRARDKRPEERKADGKRWRANNPEKARTASADWAAKNPDAARKSWREYSSRRRREDLQYRVKHILRTRIHSALKRRTKVGSAVRDLGCTLGELICHIEERFTVSMTWKNWGSVWQLDHIKPLAGFDLSNRDQFLVACCYKNLQPLLIDDHKKKTKNDMRSLALAA